MFNRWIEDDLLDVLDAEQIGRICFSSLAMELLTDKCLDGVPAGSRGGRQGDSWKALLTGETLAKIRTLNDIAARRGQSLAQMALAWTLRDTPPRQA